MCLENKPYRPFERICVTVLRADFTCIDPMTKKTLDARLRGHDGGGDPGGHSRESGNPVLGHMQMKTAVAESASWIRAFNGKTTPLFASAIITTDSYLSPA